MSPWQAAPISLTAQDTDAAGNTGTSNTVVYTLNTTVPAVRSIMNSGAGITNGIGDLNAGKLVTLTVTFSEAVNCQTGSPDARPQRWGEPRATTTGPVRAALTFNYTVAAGQNPPLSSSPRFNLYGSDDPGRGIEQCRSVGRDQ